VQWQVDAVRRVHTTYNFSDVMLLKNNDVVAAGWRMSELRRCVRTSIVPGLRRFLRRPRPSGRLLVVWYLMRLWLRWTRHVVSPRWQRRNRLCLMVAANMLRLLLRPRLVGTWSRVRVHG